MILTDWLGFSVMRLQQWKQLKALGDLAEEDTTDAAINEAVQRKDEEIERLTGKLEHFMMVVENWGGFGGGPQRDFGLVLDGGRSFGGDFPGLGKRDMRLLEDLNAVREQLPLGTPNPVFGPPSSASPPRSELTPPRAPSHYRPHHHHHSGMQGSPAPPWGTAESLLAPTPHVRGTHGPGWGDSAAPSLPWEADLQREMSHSSGIRPNLPPTSPAGTPFGSMAHLVREALDGWENKFKELEPAEVSILGDTARDLEGLKSKLGFGYAQAN